MTALSQHRSLLSTMQSMILFGLITATVTVNGGRINGDPLLVGDVVRIRVIIEEDNYFGVVACGSVECGGVRLDGLDKNGIGFSTFISHIEDVQTADKENKTLRLRWVLKQDTSSGTFETGRQHIFVVSRPTPRKMLFWIDGKNDSVIETFLKEGPATLRVVYANGPYNFIDKQSKPEQKTIPDSVCAAAQLDSYRAELNDSNADALEVLVGCRHKSDDKVDAMCIVYIAVEGDKTKVEIFRSKTSPDTYVATGSVKLPFRFQEQQILVMEVYQGMTSCEKPKSSQLIGTNQTHLSRVNALGKVEISASTPQEVFYTSFQLNCEDKVTLSLSGKNIPGDRDVFLKIMRAPSQGVSEKFQSKSFLEVAETDVVPRDIDFVHWGNLTLSVKELCDGDYDLPIKIYAFGVDDEGSKLIGAFETTLNGIKNQHGGFLLRAQSGAQGLAYNNTGVVFVGEIPIPPTFSQYVAVGFELVGSIQIDFTGSNEAVTPSLHDVTGNLTSYEVAIISVGEVVEKFVADSVFKVHGFGATIPGDATESFDFGINLDTGSPDCKGVTGVRKAYRNAVPRLNMGGPTHFAPGIKKLVDHAKRFSDGSKYFVHLLLSDGLLHDAKETEQAILEASSLPISIIIVGIGNIDFSELKTVIEHVSATKKLNNTVGHTERDIVQFVAMKDFVASNSSETLRALRKRVLSKIPPQYLEYMRIKKIAPKPIKGFTKTRVC